MIARFAIITSFALLLSVCSAPGQRASPAAPSPNAEPSLPAGTVVIGTNQFRHNGWHSRVCLADGGKTVVVLERGGVLRWWDIETGKKVHELKLKGSSHDAALAPGANLFAIAGIHQADRELGAFEHHLWLVDVAQRKLLHTVKLPSRTGGNHQKVRISEDGKRVCVEYEGDVQIIDGKTGEELLRHKGAVNAGALALSRDGKLVAFGRYDVFLWRWETGEEPKKFAAVGNFGTELITFSPDGKTLHIIPHGTLLSSWDVDTGRQIGMTPLRSITQSLQFSPDGKTLAVASHPAASKPPEGGHAIDLLDTVTRKEVGRLPLGAIGVGSICWSADGARLAGVTDNRAWVWDVKSGQVLGPNRPGHDGLIMALTFGPDGTLFTASDDHTIRSWNTTTRAPGLTLVHGTWVRGLAVSPDGTLLAGSELGNDLRIWNAKSGKMRFKLLGNGRLGGKRHVRFTADGKHLIAWGEDEFIRVWDVRNGKLQAEHPTGPPIAAGDPDDPLMRVEARMRLSRLAYETVEISPDGTAMALSSGKAIRILDPRTGKERQTLAAGDAQPQALAFAPDGQRLAVANRGKVIRTTLPDGRMRASIEKTYPVTLWDLASGKALWTVQVDGQGAQLAYSPDGSRVAVLSNGSEERGRIIVWNAATGKEAGQIELASHGFALAFDQTGKRLAVSLDDTTALVYNLETALQPTK